MAARFGVSLVEALFPQTALESAAHRWWVYQVVAVDQGLENSEQCDRKH